MNLDHTVAKETITLESHVINIDRNDLLSMIYEHVTLPEDRSKIQLSFDKTYESIVVTWKLGKSQ